jgi:disulfide bond formation protein DsbB
MSRVASGARSSPIDRRLGFVAILSIAAVGAALVTQHGFGMEPCPWCVLQRVLFLAIASACVIGLAWRSATGRALGATLVLLLALGGAAAALYQHFVAAVSESCNLTLADKILNFLTLPSLLPDVFSPRASCADAAVKLLGVSYEFWSLGLFVLFGLTALTVLARARRR